MTRLSGNLINNAKNIFLASSIGPIHTRISRKVAAEFLFDPSDAPNITKLVCVATSAGTTEDLFIFVNMKADKVAVVTAAGHSNGMEVSR